MKRIFLTCFLALTIAASAALTPRNGGRVLVADVVLKGAYREVHLFWPDGREQLVPVESAKALNRYLRFQSTV